MSLREAIEELPTETLANEIRAQLNAIRHLRRSNAEMLEFDPEDADLIMAVTENQDVMKRHWARVKTMVLRLNEVDGHSELLRAILAEMDSLTPDDQ